MNLGYPSGCAEASCCLHRHQIRYFNFSRRSVHLDLPPLVTLHGSPGQDYVDVACQIAFMNLAKTARNAFPAAGLLDEEGARIFQVVSIWYSLPLLGLALYLWITPLVLYTVGIIKIRKFRWTMSFWSLTFPC